IVTIVGTMLWPLLLYTSLKEERRKENADEIRILGQHLPSLNPDAVDADILPSASGEFGYSPDNPIPTNGIQGTINYLRRLRDSAGNRLEFRRIGSFESSSTSFPVDGYRINYLAGERESVLYFSPYQLRISR